jgi:hypothetical protein
MEELARVRVPFTLDAGGKTYACEREIIGTDSRAQIIHVTHVGSKEDAAVYGTILRPIDMMVSMARLIAREIINASMRKK